ncbi:hypothetical protein [Aurantimonas marina]|uniref:hypothetical protein n=1 Tax=Aurantimonas marina TaxID=2780508 RepID=UPI0019D1A2B1|nr:hypothetical protein [Aurantimonas marina]
MPVDDDVQLAEDVEAALNALGIARLRSRSTGLVQPYVLELSGAKRTETASAEAQTRQSETDSSTPARQDRASRHLRLADPRALPPTPE